MLLYAFFSELKVPSLTGLLPIYFGLLICTVCDNNIKSPFICVVFCIVNNYQRLKFFIKLSYNPLIYSKDKQDISNLRFGFKATHREEGAESLK